MVNTQKFNTDIESDSVDDILLLNNELSVAEVLEIRKYIYVNLSNIKKVDDGNYKYAKVTLYFDNSIEVIKIPKFKLTKTKDDLINYFKTLYSTVKKVDVTIITKTII